MSRFLSLDIGAGTLDVLYYDDASGVHYKAVVKSPVVSFAERMAHVPGNLLITGCEMGGGPLSQLLASRAKRDEIVMSRSAAATVHHNLEKVRSLGIKVIEDRQAEELRDDGEYNHCVIGDLEKERLEGIVEGFGVPFEFDVVGICAQDHGVPPPEVSHLDYRHKLFRSRLDSHPTPHSLLYEKDGVPSTLNRLTSIAKNAERLPTDEVYLMDSGMAAILGASSDHQATRKERLLILDVATSHTLAGALEKGEIDGFFEYHTKDITLDRLETLLVQLANGTLDHEQILGEGGHGAYMRKSLGFEKVEIILATGPKRALVKGSRLPIAFGAPFGDNMMTGAVGLLEAVRRHKGLGPIQYL